MKKSNPFADRKATMEFVCNSPNAFVAPSMSHVPISSCTNLSNIFVNHNVNSFAMPSPQHWQTTSQNNSPAWTHNVPNVMPWSSNSNFSSPIANANLSTNYYPQPQLPLNESHISSSANIQSVPFSSCSTSNFSSPCLQNNLNYNNKRHVSPLEEDIDIDFDFDNKRPIKKYICEDKVLEIFDRLHIREGEHYIVEDASDEPINSNSEFKHNVVIEVLENDETDYILELSPELQKAFQNNCSSITDKLLENEKEKFSKAVVLWQPNTVLQSVLPSLSDGDNSQVDDEEVKIEEIFSDEDEEMYNCENEVPIEQITQVDEWMD